MAVCGLTCVGQQLKLEAESATTVTPDLVHGQKLPPVKARKQVNQVRSCVFSLSIIMNMLKLLHR